MNDIIYASAKSIAKAIKEKEISSFEVVESCLKQIEKVNPKINAVVCMDEEEALSEAKKADDELSKGHIRGPLHGVPMTIKDNLDTAGMVTTGGTKGRKSFIPKVDATVVSRLREAGALNLKEGKTMRGLQMEDQLMISNIIKHAAVYHSDTEIIDRDMDGSIFRYTYREAHERSKKLAQAITRLGVKPGDRVGSLAWNTHRHFEMFYGISGTGAVLHTVNPRLFRDQLIYIINHCEDLWIFCDLETLPIVENLYPDLSSVKGYCLMADESDMPNETPLKNLKCYEALLDAEDGDYTWPTFDEYTASTICYTSGTTGNPKGVVYSHRSAILSSLTLN